MKLLTQGDDFGYTPAVTYGIVDAIDRGSLTCTGLFVNMPATGLAVSFMEDRPQACFGLDFNIMVGRCISDPKDIPHLAHEDGTFITHDERNRDPRFRTPEGMAELFPHDEMYREMRAQYKRFLKLCGAKPGYLNPHALMYDGYTQVIRELSEEFHVPFSLDIQERYGFANIFTLQIQEMMKRPGGAPHKPRTPDEALLAQVHKDPLRDLYAYQDYLLEHDFATLGGHPGYVDEELMESSSLSLERLRDQAFLMSQELKNWIVEHDVELISYSYFA